MNWQQLLALSIVLAAGAIFIWRSADPKKHKHGRGCGCESDAEGERAGKED